MDENTWNGKITTIEQWMSANDTGKYPALSAVPGCISAGNNSDEATKENLWGAIRHCFKDVPNSPLRKGRGTGLPADMDAAINATLTALKADLVTCWESSPAIQSNIMQHGRSGGGQYGSGEAYADAYAKSTRKRLVDGARAVMKGEEAEYHTVISDDGFAISVHQEVA